MGSMCIKWKKINDKYVSSNLLVSGERGGKYFKFRVVRVSGGWQGQQLRVANFSRTQYIPCIFGDSHNGVYSKAEVAMRNIEMFAGQSTYMDSAISY